MKRPPDPFWPIFALCGVANFLVFWVASMLLGGDALNGSTVEGHYYLANHGQLTEVSRGVWIYSWAHAFVTVTTFPLVFIVGFVQELMHGPGLDGRKRGVRWPWRRL